MATSLDDVDTYIRSFPDEVAAVLEQLRRRVLAAAPSAQESISYRIPTFSVGGKALVYLAGWKHHVSLYPLPSGDEAFEQELAPYRSGRGTVKFAMDKPIPYELVTRVVERLLDQRASDG